MPLSLTWTGVGGGQCPTRSAQLIAEARIKTDVIDATVLAHLYASGFLPEVWMPDARTEALRRQVTRRMQIVRQRARLKTMIQSILHAHLVPPCPHADLLGPKGRAWLLAQPLPPDEVDAVARHLREYDRLGEDLLVVEREIAWDALANPDAKRLMTIPGIDLVVAVGLPSAVGPVTRFEAPDRLVSYLGLNPTAHQSGEGAAPAWADLRTLVRRTRLWRLPISDGTTPVYDCGRVSTRNPGLVVPLRHAATVAGGHL